MCVGGYICVYQSELSFSQRVGQEETKEFLFPSAFLWACPTNSSSCFKSGVSMLLRSCEGL